MRSQSQWFLLPKRDVSDGSSVTGTVGSERGMEVRARRPCGRGEGPSLGPGLRDVLPPRISTVKASKHYAIHFTWEADGFRHDPRGYTRSGSERVRNVHPLAQARTDAGFGHFRSTRNAFCKTSGSTGKLVFGLHLMHGPAPLVREGVGPCKLPSDLSREAMFRTFEFRRSQTSSAEISLGDADPTGAVFDGVASAVPERNTALILERGRFPVTRAEPFGSRR